jgi:hypothetical protein
LKHEKSSKNEPALSDRLLELRFRGEKTRIGCRYAPASVRIGTNSMRDPEVPLALQALPAQETRHKIREPSLRILGTAIWM